MRKPLLFKQRVRAKAEKPVRPPRPRRSWLPGVGAAVWIATAGLCVGIVQGDLPVRAWLEQEEHPGGDLPAQLAGNGHRRPVARSHGQHSAPWMTQRRDLLAGPLAEPTPLDVTVDAVHSRLAGPAIPGAADVFGPASQPRSGTGRSAPGTPVRDEVVPESQQQRRVPALRPGSGDARQSCEGAIAAYRHRVMAGMPGRISLSRNRLVLDRGSYLTQCDVPQSTGVRICAAILGGRAVGVTVHTRPLDHRVQRCVADAVRALAFRRETWMDVTQSEFAPL